MPYDSKQIQKDKNVFKHIYAQSTQFQKACKIRENLANNIINKHHRYDILWIMKVWCMICSNDLWYAHNRTNIYQTNIILSIYHYGTI